MPSKTTTIWLLIADGSRAKVMETDDRGAELRNLEDMARSIDLPRSQDILADRPGRTFDSVGEGRHAKENPTDPHRQHKRDFARTVVTGLREAMLARRFDRLILVAPPAFMGDLRKQLPKGLQSKVAGEITSDLTNTPEQELPAHLKDILDRAT